MRPDEIEANQQRNGAQPVQQPHSDSAGSVAHSRRVRRWMNINQPEQKQRCRHAHADDRRYGRPTSDCFGLGLSFGLVACCRHFAVFYTLYPIPCTLLPLRIQHQCSKQQRQNKSRSPSAGRRAYILDSVSLRARTIPRKANRGSRGTPAPMPARLPHKSSHPCAARTAAGSPEIMSTA